MTRISVAMATYNGAAHVTEQLASLAEQTFRPHELHVGDDGSTDDTLERIAEFAESAPFPVHIHCNSRNLGFGENFIQVANRCSGDWVAFCDQDDVWLPHKLEWAVEKISEGPADLALLAHNATATDTGLRPLKKLYDYPAEERTGPLGLPPEWFCIGVTQLFRRDLIAAIPSGRRVSFPWHQHRQAHDVWIALIANCVGTVLRTNQPLILYRRHSGTITDQAKSAEGQSLLRFHGSNYRDRASYLEGVSQLLSELATQSEPQFTDPLGAASQQIAVHAALLKDRGLSLTAKNLRDRLAALRRVVAAGGYAPQYRWSFGRARMAKDIVGALVAPAIGLTPEPLPPIARNGPAQ